MELLVELLVELSHSAGWRDRCSVHVSVLVSLNGGSFRTPIFLLLCSMCLKTPSTSSDSWGRDGCSEKDA